MSIKLPCPRFEFRWVKTGDTWYQRECIYSLVFPLRELDIRREDREGNDAIDEHFAEIGRTKVSGGSGEPPIYEDGLVQIPFRDGAHVKWDKEALGVDFPIIAICGEKWSEIE